MKRALLTTLFSLYVFCVPIPAQNSSALPKLLPSYSEDFSDYNSFPSICIANTFYDQHGKLWLVPCRNVHQQTSLHLLQFDGYDFRFIQGELDQLPNECDILGIFKDNEIVVLPSYPDTNQLFFYDLETTQLRSQKLDRKGTLIFGRIIENQRLLLLFQNGKECTITEWEDSKLLELGKVSLPFAIDEFSKVVKLSEEEVWFRMPENSPDLLLRYHFITGTVKTYDRSSFEPISQNDYSPFYVDGVTDNWYHKPKKETTYFFRANERHNQMLYHFDRKIDTFRLVEGIPLNLHGTSRVFQDDLGNILFLYADQGRNFHAILQDTNGKRFDYSAFFSEFKGSSISSILSPSFKERVILSTETGIVMKEVVNTNGIQHFLEGTSIRAMVELPNRQVLISSHDIGSYLLDLNTNSVIKFRLPGCPFEFETFRLFYGTNSAGNIVTAEGNNFVIYNPRTGHCTYFPTTSEHTIDYHVMIDDNKAAFLSKDLQVHLYRFSSQETIAVLDQGEPLAVSGSINGMSYDQSKNILWIATSIGLWKIDLTTNKTESLEKEAGFLDTRFLGMAKDKKGRLWLGTPLRGLHIYNPDTKEVKVLNSDGGLANNTVASILEDDDGDWWLGTYNGISLVTAEGELIANFRLNDGLVEKENNRFARLKTKDGLLLIGTINGLNVIDPKVLKQRIKQSSDLKIYLNSVEYFDRQKKEKTTKVDHLTDLGTFHLPASQRFLNLRFGLSNYFKPEENRFAYKLEGIDKDWNYLGTQPSLSLSNLPAGNFRLLIKGSDATGLWTEEPLVLSIHAREFFYKQPWFYLLLITALFAGGLTWIRRLRTEVKKATHKIRQQAEQLKDLDKAKSIFFTNISHEFRTPLTVISGLAGRLEKHPEERQTSSFQMIRRNSANLLNLVNQILDLRKLESGKLKVNLIQADVIPYLHYIFESFESLARGKDIDISMVTALDSLVMDYDKKKLLRIVSNLLSNAIKFTPEGGNIIVMANTLGVSKTPRVLAITIKDNGIGIPKKKRPHIFDRFYQADGTATRVGEGTGIGLALCKELVTLLGGTIEVETEEGEGSTFSVTLPITNNASTTEEAPQDFVLASETGLAAFEPVLLSNPEEAIASGAELPLILLVEDNADVRQYLITCLQGSYNLLIAQDGQEGIDKAIEAIPDAIISDVMMPHKDGFELCYTLKTDERTSHIPIILLTAKADVDSRLSGLRRGADDYLTKPFNEEELLTRLSNQLEIRRRLQLYFQHAAQQPPAEITEEVKLEHEFLGKIKSLLEEHLDDENYGIAELCRGIGASRTQLHRKIKALTGESTSIYIRRFRLHKAKELLETTDMNVSEVLFEVGFSSLSYFSRVFSIEFGINPSEVVKR